MQRKTFLISADIITISLILILANLRSFVVLTKFPNASKLRSQAWIEVMVWAILYIEICIIKWETRIYSRFIRSLLKQKVLIAFVLFSLISTFWSISWTTTIQRSLVFLFASLIGVYLTTRYSLTDFVRILFWGGFIFLCLSFVLIFRYPIIGTDLNHPFNGAWRGIFWHKNHLGNLFPLFSLVFLITLFDKSNSFSKLEKITALPLYLLTLLLVYFSRSASGYIIEIILISSFTLAMLWMKFADRLNTKYYIIIIFLLLVLLITIFSNLDFIFGLFNREVHLTGRVPLWNYLLESHFSKNPWLGHGFGTFWTLKRIRSETQQAVGWPYPIMIGDNGFIDILLNTGLIGSALFLIIYIKLCINSLHYALTQRTLISMFAPLLMIYTFFANLSFSLFMETEVFVWLVMVAVLIAINTENKNPLNNISKTIHPQGV